MLIAYLSLTGNVRRFVGAIGIDNIEIDYSSPLVEVNEDFIVITPTYDDEVTDIISEFVEYKNNINHLVGFVGSGNTNFDKDYCFNARDLSKKYDKPLIFRFEFSGTHIDIARFIKEVERIEIARAK